MPLKFLSMAFLEIAAIFVLLSAILTYLYRPRYSWSAVHGNHSPYDFCQHDVPMGESAFLSPWAVEYGPNPFIFPAVFAAYNLARVAFGNLEEQEGMHEESHDGPSSSPDLIEDMAEIMVKTCDKCGSSFRTPGLLRSVRRHSFHEEPHIF
jgi:hypothetical protein